MKSTRTLPSLLKRFFIDYLPVQRGLAANTILSYRDAIKMLLCFSADTRKKSVDTLTVEDLSEKIVLEFLAQVEQARGCSSKTRNVRLAAIRAFFGFIAREEPSLVTQAQRIRSIPLKRTEHKMAEYLDEKEMQALFDAVDLDSRTGIRDRALLMLFYNTGARVTEIVQLAVEDLRFDAPQVRILGKGKKHRSCPLWPETIETLEAYLKRRTPQDPVEKRLFLNADGVPITRFGVRYVIRKYAAEAKSRCPSLATKAVTPHMIRHATAMHLLRAGSDINMISYWLGHAGINTAHMYVEIDMEMKRAMLEKADDPPAVRSLLWQKPKVLRWLNALSKAPELCAVNPRQNPRGSR